MNGSPCLNCPYKGRILQTVSKVRCFKCFIEMVQHDAVRRFVAHGRIKIGNAVIYNTPPALSEDKDSWIDKLPTANFGLGASSSAEPDLESPDFGASLSKVISSEKTQDLEEPASKRQKTK